MPWTIVVSTKHPEPTCPVTIYCGAHAKLELCTLVDNQAASRAEHVTVQENHRAWMHDSMNKLDGEAVEKEVASNVRTMHKTGKAFAQRGLQAYATNCDTIKAEIEEFQKVVPLLVVSISKFNAEP